MRIQTILALAAALTFSLPLSAAHRHGRECGHFFDSRQGSWISVQIGTPLGFGVVRRGDGYDDRRYDRHRYQDSRRFRHDKKRWKKFKKQRLRNHRQFQSRRHIHGPHCWR